MKCNSPSPYQLNRSNRISGKILAVWFAQRAPIEDTSVWNLIAVSELQNNIRSHEPERHQISSTIRTNYFGISSELFELKLKIFHTGLLRAVKRKMELCNAGLVAASIGPRSEG